MSRFAGRQTSGRRAHRAAAVAAAAFTVAAAAGLAAGPALAQTAPYDRARADGYGEPYYGDRGRVRGDAYEYERSWQRFDPDGWDEELTDFFGEVFEELRGPFSRDYDTRTISGVWTLGRAGFRSRCRLHLTRRDGFGAKEAELAHACVGSNYDLLGIEGWTLDGGRLLLLDYSGRPMLSFRREGPFYWRGESLFPRRPDGAFYLIAPGREPWGFDRTAGYDRFDGPRPRYPGGNRYEARVDRLTGDWRLVARSGDGCAVGLTDTRAGRAYELAARGYCPPTLGRLDRWDHTPGEIRLIDRTGHIVLRLTRRGDYLWQGVARDGTSYRLRR